MSFIIASLVVSAILLAVFAALAHSRAGGSGVLIAAAAAMVFFLCISPALFFQSLLTVLIAAYASLRERKPEFVVRGALVAVALGYVAMLLLAVPGLRALARMRQDYPVVSLAERLSYEDEKTSARDSRANSEQRPLASAVEQQLQHSEDDIESWRSRSSVLASLHDRTADEFVTARGFGLTRMPGIPLHKIDLPEPQPVPQMTPPEYSTGQGLPLVDIPRAPDQRPTPDTLHAMHFSGVSDFLNKDRLGYARDRDHVAGFQPHQFSQHPVAIREQTRMGWQVVRLELVSLLRHETPVAYVSPNLPRMDELRNAPTRPLNAREIEAVARLRSEEDVVIDEEGDRIHMVGSLRASKVCLNCHAVPRGELLGGLTYELAPDEAFTKPAVGEASREPQARVLPRRSTLPHPVPVDRFNHPLASGQ